jgi:DNA polymerase-1
MSQRKKLVLFDGHALLHRGYHAIPYLSTKDGTPTNAVYGFVTIMLKALTDLKPDYVAVAWDLPGKTFRHDMYADYKGTRKKTDDELIAQMPLTREVVEAFNMPLMEREGYEADDVIGTLAYRYGKELEVVIVTGDMDELQLVDDHVKVYTMRRGFSDTVLYDRAAVEAKYGVTPEEFVVYKALKGDTSDNIPGVPGVGDKTATDLVSKYKTLDGIYDHLDELKSAVRKKLEENRKLADLSLELSRISREVELDFDLKKAHIHDYDKKHVHELFHRLEFRSLLAKLPGHNTVNTISDQNSLFEEENEANNRPEPNRDHLKTSTYTCVNSAEKLKDLAAKLSKQKKFAFDTETDSLDVIDANLVGMSFSWKAGEAYYVPVGHAEGEQLELEGRSRCFKTSARRSEDRQGWS